jgi:hypothetical protein
VTPTGSQTVSRHTKQTQPYTTDQVIPSRTSAHLTQQCHHACVPWHTSGARVRCRGSALYWQLGVGMRTDPPRCPVELTLTAATDGCWTHH